MFLLVLVGSAYLVLRISKMKGEFFYENKIEEVFIELQTI